MACWFHFVSTCYNTLVSQRIQLHYWQSILLHWNVLSSLPNLVRGRINVLQSTAGVTYSITTVHKYMVHYFIESWEWNNQVLIVWRLCEIEYSCSRISLSLHLQAVCVRWKLLLLSNFSCTISFRTYCTGLCTSLLYSSHLSRETYWVRLEEKWAFTKATNSLIRFGQAYCTVFRTIDLKFKKVVRFWAYYIGSYICHTLPDLSIEKVYRIRFQNMENLHAFLHWSVWIPKIMSELHLNTTYIELSQMWAAATVHVHVKRVQYPTVRTPYDSTLLKEKEKEKGPYQTNKGLHKETFTPKK